MPVSETPAREQSDAFEAAAGELRKLLGERLSTNISQRAAHGCDESFHKAAPPDAVAFPQSTEEVAHLVGICNKHNVPMIPFGAGTSLEGHVAALHGGVSIDLSQMDQILEVNQEDMDCLVQAGVRRVQLNQHLRDSGMFFPIDPGADATIGGMAATRASGTNAVRYGTMANAVLSVTAVMPDGDVVRTARRARKSSSGYDLTALLVGSEGTLGVMTEITLRLHGIPDEVLAGVCPFETIEGAIAAVISTIQSGIPIARIELLDELQMHACNKFSDLDYSETSTLFVEFHGSTESVREQAEAFGGIAALHGGGRFRWATVPEQRSSLWQARHDALYAARALQPGKQAMVTDVCVPISRLATCIAETKADLAHSFLLAPLVGHVGDGNFHLILLVDPESPADLKEAEHLHDRLVRRALRMEGTCTGEHGIGYGKISYLKEEHGAGIAVMRRIKLALDPLNLMNPGKIMDVLDTSSASGEGQLF